MSRPIGWTKPKIKPCRICGNPVIPTRRKDRNAFWYPRQCPQCYHKARDEALRRQRVSAALAGMNHPRAHAIGTRIIVSRRRYKYWKIKVGERRTDWQYEHRFVLEQKLHRPLLPIEIAHHINGNTLDNRPENIELFNWGEHTSLHHSPK